MPWEISPEHRNFFEGEGLFRAAVLRTKIGKKSGVFEGFSQDKAKNQSITFVSRAKLWYNNRIYDIRGTL